MDLMTPRTRAAIALASIVITLGLFQSVASLGSLHPADHGAALALAQAPATTSVAAVH